MKTVKLLPLLLSIFFCSSVFAQSLERSTISSAGTFYDVSGVKLSWSAAQPGLVETFSNSTATLTQGFHQKAFFVSIEEVVPNLFTIKVYPNPGSGEFFFDLKAMQEGEIELRLFDSRGRLIFSEGSFATINSMWDHRINIGYLPIGIYHCRFSFKSADGKLSVKNLKLSVIK